MIIYHCNYPSSFSIPLALKGRCFFVFVYLFIFFITKRNGLVGGNPRTYMYEGQVWNQRTKFSAGRCELVKGKCIEH